MSIFSLRAHQAQWFETYVPREQTVFALNAFSRTDAVELEMDPALAVPMDLALLRETIAQFDNIRAKYADNLPSAVATATKLTMAPEIEAANALQKIEDWAQRFDAVQDGREQAAAERKNLMLVKECFTALRGDAGLLGSLSHASKLLYKGAFACPRTCCTDARVDASVRELIPGTEHDFFIVADLREHADDIQAFFGANACVEVDIPAWFIKAPEKQMVGLEKALQRRERSEADAQEALSRLRQETAIKLAVANISVLRWYLDEARKTGAKDQLCHVSGWVAAGKADQLQKALDTEKINARVAFPMAPEGLEPPVSLIGAWWVQPFQIFTVMQGAPGKTEVDPGPLLALVVPLLFGYMFPDLGHGLVLVLASAFLYRRWPNGRFLIPCGISASVFGLLQGEIFGLHGILPPLWVDPLQEPLVILAVPMVFGVFLILLGLVFNGIEAYWRAALEPWLLSEAAVLFLYASLTVGLFYSAAFWVSGFALIWYLLGGMLLVYRHQNVSLAQVLGHLLESVFSLALNTVSFLRVGAFALAHAALNEALLLIAGDIETIGLRWMFLIGGHASLIALEALVVFVQTTRLILYEFFIRFLNSEGRAFRPLAVPPQSGEPTQGN